MQKRTLPKSDSVRECYANVDAAIKRQREGYLRLDSMPWMGCVDVVFLVCPVHILKSTVFKWPGSAGASGAVVDRRRS